MNSDQPDRLTRVEGVVDSLKSVVEKMERAISSLAGDMRQLVQSETERAQDRETIKRLFARQDALDARQDKFEMSEKDRQISDLKAAVDENKERRREWFRQVLTMLGVVGAALILYHFGIAPAKGAEIEVGAGETVFGHQPNEIYWEQGYPHTFDLRSASVSIGLMGDLLPSVRWRAGYEQMGTAHSYATVLANDPSYEEATHGCYAGANCARATMDTSGRLQGMYATLQPYIGPAFVEVGAWAYLPQFQVNTNGANAGSLAARVRLGGIAGCGLHLGHWSLALTKRTDDASGPYAPWAPQAMLPTFYHGGAWNLSARVTL